MAQLIQIRSQIRAVESIKKITHAMRLISRSSHAQLNSKKVFLENYQKELLHILCIINKEKNISNILPSNVTESNKKLIIIVGSQKGLAGQFNNILLKFFENDINQNYNNIDVICIGKKICDYIKKKTDPILTYDNFSINNLNKIAKNIFKIINESNPNYTNVIFYNNYPKSFFLQIPQKNILIPQTDINSANDSVTENLENYIWEESVNDIHNFLMKEFLLFSIQMILNNSLIAEFSARFHSMDSATTNAEELLNKLKLQYNKLRQTKITKEIIELSTSFSR